MTKEDLRLCKKKILKCLTEDFTYGRRKDGKPLKRPKKNQAIFMEESGNPVFSGLDLTMVMDKVILGLYFALEDSDEERKNK
jgi:hypothetical protein